MNQRCSVHGFDEENLAKPAISSRVLDCFAHVQIGSPEESAWRLEPTKSGGFLGGFPNKVRVPMGPR